LKPLKKKVKQLVRDIEDEIAAQFPGDLGKKTKLIFSDPKGNFRYDLYPEYKSGRKEIKKSPEYYALRKWALKKYGYIKNIEADDAMWYYIKKGYISVSMDKDVRKTLPGQHFNPHYMHRNLEYTGELEARNFLLIQSVMGDSTDDIPGIKGVGEKTAIKLLDRFGWDDEGCIKAYESKGLTKEDWLLTMRLVNLQQYDVKRKKLKLYLS
jgi:DNA polymerase-1